MGYVICGDYHKKIASRKLVVALYRERLARVPGIRLVPEKMDVVPNYSYFPILIDEKVYGRTRDELFNYLKEFNVISRKYFYPLTTDCECYAEKYSGVDVPVARYTAERILTIPLYGELGLAAAQSICEIISDFAL
jgi:dTDP-4-amino-4,6-dideoxygalactose transaminase